MKTIILVILGILIIGGIVLVSNLDSTAKTIIETAGTKALGTPVHVSGLKISLVNKTASMSGLSIANPPGFKTGDLLNAKSITVAIGDIVNKTLTIREITVDGLTMTYELGLNGTNFDALKKNMQAAPSTSPAAEKAAGNSVDQKSGYNMIIQKLAFLNAQVVPSVGVRSAPVKLPGIIMTNIGSQKNPATPEQVAKQIMGHVLAWSSTFVVKSGLSALPAASAVDKAQSAVKNLLSK